MDLTQIHLVLNHVPLLGMIFGFSILAWGAFRGSVEVQKIGLMALFVAALVAVPVYLTGEPAESAVEHLPGVTGQVIDVHEESAMYSLVLSIATGVLALTIILFRRVLSSRAFVAGVYVVLLSSLIAGASIAFTASLGGQIRHTEIRQQQGGDPGAPAKPEKNDSDHDE